MDGIENARHDLSEATCSVDTAIELLASMKRDGFAHQGELQQIIGELKLLKSSLEHSYQRLHPLLPEARKNA